VEHQLPVSLVCRVLGASRSTIYARRRVGGQPGRPGPVPPIGDQELVRLIRRVLADSPFAGQGYRKVRTRLRREHGVQVSGKRVLRLLRREGLLAPSEHEGGAGRGPMTARSSRRCPTGAGAPMRPWPGPGPTGGCGCSPVWTTTPPRRGRMWPRSATGSPPCSRSMTRSSTAGAGWTPTSPAACSCATTGDRNTAQATSWARSPGWALPTTPRSWASRRPTAAPNAGIRTLKEQCLWAELHDGIDELRQAVAGFVHTYNTQWLIGRHGYRTPKEAYQDATTTAAA
jgi:putative transposase